VLPAVFVFNQGILADENHNHFIHDYIQPIPAIIAETAAKAAADSTYAINANRMDVVTNGAVFWNTSFGSNQEVYANLPTIDSGNGGIDLLLKSQNNTNPNAGVIEVWYKPSDGRAQV
jgi:hypothetical protein